MPFIVRNIMTSITKKEKFLAVKPRCVIDCMIYCNIISAKI